MSARLILLILLLPAYLLKAQDHAPPRPVRVIAPDQVKSMEQYLRKPISARPFDAAKWRKVVGATTFREKAETPPEIKALPYRINERLLTMIVYGLTIAVLLLLVYLAYKRMSTGVPLSKEIPSGSSSATDENLRVLDLAALLREAVAAGDFRAAVRFHYLGLLKRLDATGRIVLTKGKTNRDYVHELKASEQRDGLAALTLVYEQVWYGEYGIDAQSFQRVASRFNTFNPLLTPGE